MDPGEARHVDSTKRGKSSANVAQVTKPAPDGHIPSLDIEVRSGYVLFKTAFGNICLYPSYFGVPFNFQRANLFSNSQKTPLLPPVTAT